MPVIKSAKKRMKQSAARRLRNFPLRSELKTLVKKALKLAKEGKIEELTKFFPHVFSVIDTADKKNLIHKNNAARKKSRIAKVLNDAIKGGGKAEAAPEVKEKKVKKEKKEEKAEAAKEEKK